MGKTIFEKIWSEHCVSEINDEVGLLLIDRILLHERTGGVALQGLATAGRTVKAPHNCFATMDHVVDTLPGRTDETTMPTGKSFITATRAAAKAAGIRLFDIGDPRQGIVHVMSPEQAIVLPGLTLVCPDSHTLTQGALGALAWGIGSTEAEHALATSTLRVTRPKTMRVTVEGLLHKCVTAKDLALFIISRFGSSGAKGHVVEYAGPAIDALDIEARMTLCNMTAEFGAFSAIIAPDMKVFAYLRGRPFAPDDTLWSKAVAHWRGLVSDPDALFDIEHRVNASEVQPMVSWGTNPEQSIAISDRVAPFMPNAEAAATRALNYMDLKPGSALEGLKIDAAFIGSCTNSRISDLRRAAAILRGRKVASGVRAICVPGSTTVKLQAEAEGLHKIFIEAGFEWRESGCSMCFFAGGESFGLHQRVITSTNRNFESRQGPNTRSHLASPETVAASALAGHISDPRMVML
ncbi:3-isopropylmalate dehydratase large subunit (plasmid) [Acidiphilium multivorum]|uniref:3-isopropylmalate dehydratase large subunit n=1 Tax=Acidiphilium multivorum TaxID=62140 RepID=UPI001F4C1BF2|nr:3-isopropylmalate dehydratase large subunit [Acidiphilium multivorum]UNC16537.1 3-isopropylmalate dehydratase large subunit [Acidiphilium multivorum]